MEKLLAEKKSAKLKFTRLITYLENALKDLKNKKARDPNGWCNKIFKDGVAGKNLTRLVQEEF